jgi:hypothetical protein
VQLDGEEKVNAREVQQNVRRFRKGLVEKAEAVMAEVFKDPKMKLSKAQLSQLTGVCGEATCHEEIANYLRYQAGRGQGWDIKLVARTVEGFEGVLGREQLSDQVRVEAWRWYATYLSRAFTYRKEAGGQG